MAKKKLNTYRLHFVMNMFVNENCIYGTIE